MTGCEIFLDCLHTGERTDVDFFAVSDSNGRADVIFPEGVEQYEAKVTEECDFVFDAFTQPTECINVGTAQELKISQICQGNALGCDVMSNMCTLFGYSSAAAMSLAFSAESSPLMNYGDCLPCECDPIAEILAGSSRAASAQGQLVGIASTLGFVTLADQNFLGDLFPASAAESPSRQALTKAINEATGGLDFTNGDVIYALLLSAQEFHNAGSIETTVGFSGRKLDDEQNLQDLSAILLELNDWYAEQDDSGVDAIDTVRRPTATIVVFQSL
jgi:hypothetical protein